MSRFEVWVAELREHIAAKKVIAVVGAGVSQAVTKGEAVAGWRGLLLDGIDYCERAGLADARWAERQRQGLEQPDVFTWLQVASQIEHRLGRDKKNSDFRAWLKQSVGRLQPRCPEVIEALDRLGIPLVTTNYDDLIEQVTGRDRCTWQQIADCQEVFQGEANHVLHLHGHVRYPESIILRGGAPSWRETEAAVEQARRSPRRTAAIDFGKLSNEGSLGGAAADVTTSSKSPKGWSSQWNQNASALQGRLVEVYAVRKRPPKGPQAMPLHLKKTPKSDKTVATNPFRYPLGVEQGSERDLVRPRLGRKRGRYDWLWTPEGSKTMTIRLRWTPEGSKAMTIRLHAGRPTLPGLRVRVRRSRGACARV